MNTLHGQNPALAVPLRLGQLSYDQITRLGRRGIASQKGRADAIGECLVWTPDVHLVLPRSRGDMLGNYAWKGSWAALLAGRDTKLRRYHLTGGRRGDASHALGSSTSVRVHGGSATTLHWAHPLLRMRGDMIGCSGQGELGLRVFMKVWSCWGTTYQYCLLWLRVSVDGIRGRVARAGDGGKQGVVVHF